MKDQNHKAINYQAQLQRQSYDKGNKYKQIPKHNNNPHQMLENLKLIIKDQVIQLKNSKNLLNHKQITAKRKLILQSNNLADQNQLSRFYNNRTVISNPKNKLDNHYKANQSFDQQQPRGNSFNKQQIDLKKDIHHIVIRKNSYQKQQKSSNTNINLGANILSTVGQTITEGNLSESEQNQKRQKFIKELMKYDFRRKSLKNSQNENNVFHDYTKEQQLRNKLKHQKMVRDKYIQQLNNFINEQIQEEEIELIEDALKTGNVYSIEQINKMGNRFKNTFINQMLEHDKDIQSKVKTTKITVQKEKKQSKKLISQLSNILEDNGLNGPIKTKSKVNEQPQQKEISEPYFDIDFFNDLKLQLLKKQSSHNISSETANKQINLEKLRVILKQQQQ